MNNIRSARSWLFGFFLSITPFVNDLYLEKKVESSFAGQNTDLIQGLFFLILLFVCIILGVLVLSVYDKYLWKLFFRKANISGFWYYNNRYDDGRPNTEGFIIVEQTPFKIEFISGVSVSNNPHRSRTKSVIADFLSDDRLLKVYQVQRIGSDGIEHIVKRSVIEFEIHRDSSGKPKSMSADFWNCVRDKGQSALEKDFDNNVGWPIGNGQANYLRVSKREYDARTLSAENKKLWIGN